MGAPRKGRPLVMVGQETVSEFNKRLHREGRTNEFRDEAAGLQASEGITYAEARERLAGKYGAPGGGGLARPLDMQGEARLAVEVKESGRPLSFYESLCWAAGALGDAEDGVVIKRSQAPTKIAYTLYQFGRRKEAEFHKLLAAQAAKYDGGEEGSRNEGKKQVEEIERMIREVLGDSKRLVEEVEGEVTT